jgi:hypothetical protein
MYIQYIQGVLNVIILKKYLTLLDLCNFSLIMYLTIPFGCHALKCSNCFRFGVKLYIFYVTIMLLF